MRGLRWGRQERLAVKGGHAVVTAIFAPDNARGNSAGLARADAVHRVNLARPPCSLHSTRTAPCDSDHNRYNARISFHEEVV